MEEQTERKAATAVAEEPIKAEGTVEASDTSERSDGAASPPPNCSICLGKLVNTSFTDSCLHQFCFTCLLQWSKIKTECPLCKQTFKSIIHNVRSEEDYDQYHVPRELASQVATATLDVNFDFVGNVGTVGVGALGSNWDFGISRFMYRSTLGNPNRRVNMILNPHEVARREQIPSVAQQLSRDELRRRQINPSDFRRNVYRLGLWASPLPDVFGRFRECSAEFYRRHPAEITRLIPWLNRELQVLLYNNLPHVVYVLRIISDALTRYHIRSIEFHNLIRPYFGIRTEHFTHELVNFARTSFDMVGYDQSVIYLPGRSDYTTGDFGARILSPGSSSSSSTSDDSDVRVVDDSVDRRGINFRISTLLSNSIMDMPGPSTLARSFHNYVPPVAVPDVVLVSSSSSSSDDECEVIGYVKPRHERTPEIIDLSNSETEEMASQTIEINDTLPTPTSFDESQPSTSQEVRKGRKVDNPLPVQMMEILSSPSYSETSDSDSDYNPIGKHKASKKTVRRRKSSAPRKILKSKRTLSTNTFSSSSESETKHTTTKRTAKKETKHSRRVSISSGTNSEKLKKTTIKNKSKKQDTSGSNSDTPFYATSESDNESKYQNERNTGTNYHTSSDSSTARSRSSSKSRAEKTRTSRRILKKSGTTNSHSKKRDTHCDSDTLSESDKPINLSLSGYNSYDNDKKNVQEKSSDLNETIASNNDQTEKRIVYKETNTDHRSLDDLEQHRYYRSRSQCSVCSDNTRTSKKKSKHKEKRNHKSDKSSTKFYHSNEGNSMSSLNDAPSSSKHSSDSKISSRSRSKNKHKSHKKSKTSKRRRSRSTSRSKSKKKATHSTAIELQTKS
ncbi:E3 ubiquitin-protein ligase Topors [Leptopilina heterotoma]|uniref:E3 ubiquitin-protein ligase Topors n=1 Tax=Leptopilina heterotoma TaxID=63436 RepID=UPI001CA7F4C7|nr:E3 ubiquitin-protein ligase Topors [Leptopilina heterotoma]XP_043466547.1 E3 ubiquitin-protein ligase Topors [Leptopilina heterotoma]